MKVVLLAGGLGSRLAEETVRVPKPMVEVAGRPIMLHVMDIYDRWGHNDFIVACGYKAMAIKSFFQDLHLMSNDFTVGIGNGEMALHPTTKVDWRVSVVDTGLATMTGGRLKRLRSWLDDETFMVTYSDGVGNVDISALLEFHRSHGKLATVTAVQPPARFGNLELGQCAGAGGEVIEFTEKVIKYETWINGGFFVFEPGVLDYLTGDEEPLEQAPLTRLAHDGQLMAYKHKGFWHPMDTIRDRDTLDGLTAGIPVLIAMATDPEAMLAHTVRYFTELQAAYWAHSTEPKVVGLAAKVLFAEDIWTSNASLLSMAAIVALVALPLLRRGWRDGLLTVWSWPVVLTAALAAMGFVVAFVPSPSFPQYFVPPIPFLVLLAVLLRARMLSENRVAADAVLLSLALLALLCAASRLGPGLVSFARPASWEGVAVHREMRELVRRAAASSGDRVATLSPLLAVEGGLTVPPEFAAGQFVYRVAEYIPPRDRPYWTTTSPAQLTAFLDTDQPSAILISGEEPLEQPFEDYARSHGYILTQGTRNGGYPRLFRRPERPLEARR